MIMTLTFETEESQVLLVLEVVTHGDLCP